METPFGNTAEQRLNELIRRPFVQADALRPSLGLVPKHIHHNVTILRGWLDVAIEVQKQLRCSDFAFTQLNPELLNVLGFMGKIPPHVIYFGGDLRLSPLLLINSNVSIDFKKPFRPSIEACGSIDFGNIVYVASRPMGVAVSGYLYDGQTVRQIHSEHESTSMEYKNAVHEFAHIQGKTALSDPDALWDIRKFDVWMQLCRSYNYLNESEVRNTLESLGKHGLAVPDQHGCYEIVNLNEVGAR